jgi:hypothetical protein
MISLFLSYKLQVQWLVRKRNIILPELELKWYDSFNLFLKILFFYGEMWIKENTQVPFTLIYITKLHSQVCSNPVSYNGSAELKYGPSINNYVQNFSRFTPVTLINCLDRWSMLNYEATKSSNITSSYLFTKQPTLLTLTMYLWREISLGNLWIRQILCVMGTGGGVLFCEVLIQL